MHVRAVAMLAVLWSAGAWAQDVVERPARYRAPSGPVPAGYHQVTGHRWGLLTAGCITFAAGHGFSLGYALTSGWASPAIPVVGPILGMVNVPSPAYFAGLTQLVVRITLGVSLLAEVTGLVMAIISAFPTTWLERDEAPALMLVPGAAGAPAGASLIGRF